MNNKRLVIIGDGGLADEIADLAKQLDYEIVAHVAEDKYKLKETTESLEFLRISSLYDEVVFGIGNPLVKRKIFNQVPFVKKWATLISPKSYIGTNNKIHAGAVIQAGVAITCNTIIHAHALINLNCTVGHGAEIKNYCTINPSANISGNVKIGYAVLVGTGAQILNNIEIGNNSIVGASALVTKIVPENVIAKGVPAKWL